MHTQRGNRRGKKTTTREEKNLPMRPNTPSQLLTLHWRHWLAYELLLTPCAHWYPPSDASATAMARNVAMIVSARRIELIRRVGARRTMDMAMEARAALRLLVLVPVDGVMKWGELNMGEKKNE